MENKEKVIQWIEVNLSNEPQLESIKSFIQRFSFEILKKMTKEDWEKRFDDWGTFIFNELHPASKNQETG
jgi:hypothetical protein